MTTPTKKNVLLTIASLALIGGTFFAIEYKHSTTAEVINVASAGKPAQNQITADVSEKDSDGDGLKDWEEVLWGTDPHQKDTGGTGVPDNIKVQKMISEKQVAAAKISSGSTATQKQSKTDQFSQQFFTNYLEMRKAGTLDQASLDQMTLEAAAQVTTDTVAETYSLKSIRTFPDSDIVAVRRYANDFAAIHTKYQNQYSASQIAVPQSGPDFTDPALIKSFERAASLYKSMAAELVKLPVPASLAQTDVEILNAYIHSFRGLWAVSATQKDPMSAIKGLGLHTEATATETSSLQFIKQYLISKGISFTSDEPGYFWNSITNATI